MFQPLRLEVMDRFTAVRAHFRALRKLKGTPAHTAKGLAFVQMYAVYEYTVVTTMQVAIDTIAAHKRPFADLRPSLLAVFLDPMLKSLRDCGAHSVWAGRIDMLDQSCSTTRVRTCW